MLAITNVQIYTITNGIIHGSVLINDDGKIATVGEVSLQKVLLVIDGQKKYLCLE